MPEADLPRQRPVVDAFLADSREGDSRALPRALHPDVVLLADTGPGVSGERLRGAGTIVRPATGPTTAVAGSAPPPGEQDRLR